MNAPPLVQPILARFPALEEQEITLRYCNPEARAVSVAGNFNGRHPASTPMKNADAGNWVVRLMLRSGQYEYRLVVDGRWLEDPAASQRAPNPHDGFNSVFTLPLAVKTSIL
jgi:1,4-alpha-glucan branching enzyme